MTDVAASAPLQITIHPLPQAASSNTGRVVNANATVANIPDNPDFWGQGGFSFKSILDTINPLQQLPVVGSIYRAMTGDTISPGANLAGSLLFGGPIGLFASVANEIVKQQTGNDIGGSLVAMAQGKSSTQVAQNGISGSESFMSPNQRAAYNAYVRADALA